MSAAWSERARCWCGDPCEPGARWCARCGPDDAEDARSQAHEAAKHFESSRRREGRGIPAPAAPHAGGATPSTREDS